MKLYSNFLAFSLFCLSCFGQGEPIRLSERQKDLVRWAYDITREVMKTTPIPTGLTDPKPPNLVWVSDFLSKIANNDTLLERIINTKEDFFYTSTGALLQNVLLRAAENREYREIVLKGYQWEKCQKGFLECGIPSWNLDLIKFKLYNTLPFGSNLKSNLDTIEALLIALELPKSDISVLTIKDLDAYEFQMKLFAKLAPRLPELISLPCELYLGKSLKEVDKYELRSVLKKLNLFLKNVIKNAEPRHLKGLVS